MPANIRGHSLVVAAVAGVLARRLGAAGRPLDLELVEAIALLHDIGKARSLETGEHHAELGAAMLVELGLPGLAPAVRAHAGLDGDALVGPVTEALLVNYADKRVRHEQVVSLEERFEDLGARYARGPEALAYLASLLERYRELERQIFEPLDLAPGEIEELLEE